MGSGRECDGGRTRWTRHDGTAGVTSGLVVLVAALAVATVIGLAWRSRNGKMRRRRAARPARPRRRPPGRIGRGTRAAAADRR